MNKRFHRLPRNIATLCALLALLPVVAATASADSELGYSRMFVFGDSLSDPGNTFADTHKTSKPPFDPLPIAGYGIGGHRFSDGRIWIEVLAQQMELTEWAKPAYRDSAFGNYAYGYARARDFNPIPPALGADSPSLTEQVANWSEAGNCTGVPMDDTLFVLEIGGNDVGDAIAAFSTGNDPAIIIAEAIQSVVENVGYLSACGARNFMVANVPDFGLTPFALAQGAEAAAGATFMTAQFNTFLQLALEAYFGDLNLSILDFFTISQQLSDMPPEVFSNVTGTCLTFGVVKNVYCKDRGGYLFWDVLHPTKKAHAMIAGMAVGALPDSD